MSFLTTENGAGVWGLKGGKEIHGKQERKQARPGFSPPATVSSFTL